MENRASYLIVGGFVLVAIAGAFGFVIWLTQAHVNREFNYYDVYFTDSVTGLSLGGDVRYRGIPIGQVSAIAVDRADPGRVLVTIRVDADTPIREGDEASLQLLGITGVSFVNVEGASADSPLLRAGRGRARAVIPSTRSTIEQLATGAPDLLASAVALIERFSVLLNDENQAAIAAILIDVREITGAVAGRREQVARTLDSLDALSGQLVALSESATKTVANVDALSRDAAATFRELRSAGEQANDLLRQDVRLLVAELRTGAQQMGRLASTANAVLEENREPLTVFTGDGLKQFSEFLSEASLLVNGIARLTERLDNEGARFLIGDEQSEIQVQNR